MSNFKKNKKGIEGGGYSIIIGLVILVISAGIIIGVVIISANRAEEESQIGMCRLYNEFKVSVAKGKPAIVPFATPSLCSTIDKTENNLQVPTKSYMEKYETDKEAAEAEIGDMIKNCWYMWWEGSDEEIFSNYFLWFGREDGCVICYITQIRDGVEGLTEQGLRQSMENRVYSVEDMSDKCAPGLEGLPSRGGFFEYGGQECGTNNLYNLGYDLDGWKEVPSKEAKKKGVDVKCCVREDILDVCENKGGYCSDEGPIGDFQYEYGEWSCSANKICYVKGANYYSYLKYIEEYGDRNGRLDVEEGLFEGNAIAITFYSYRWANRPSNPTFIEVSTLEHAIRPQHEVGKCEIL